MSAAVIEPAQLAGAQAVPANAEREWAERGRPRRRRGRATLGRYHQPARLSPGLASGLTTMQFMEIYQQYVAAADR